MDKGLYKDILKILTFTILLIFLLFNYKITIIIVNKIFKLIYPFIIGITIAFILNVLLKKIEKVYKRLFKKNKYMRPICLTITLSIIILILILIYILVVPKVLESITIISDDLNKYITDLSNCLQKLGLQKEDINKFINYINNQKKEIINYINIDKFKNIDMLFNVASTISSIMFNLTIGIVFGIYILLQKEKLQLQIKKIMKAYLSKEKINRINQVSKLINKIFSNFIGGQFLEAIILGSLCFIGMLILRIPYATVISIIVTITALIPMFGAFIGTGIGIIFIITIEPIKAITFLIYIIILQQIEGNIIYPKVVGKTVGLPGIWVIVAATIGGSLFGLIGIILSVPIVSIIYSLIKLNVNNRLKKEI